MIEMFKTEAQIDTPEGIELDKVFQVLHFLPSMPFHYLEDLPSFLFLLQKTDCC